MKLVLTLTLLIASVSSLWGQTKVALTFDDLPSTGDYSSGESAQTIMRRVLSVLAEHKIRGVVGFVNASRLQLPGAERALADWIRGGNLVANHTWSHLDLHNASADQYWNEVVRNESLLAARYPSQFLRLFRYPFLHEGDSLEKRNSIRDRLAMSGYRIAEVTIDFNDYEWNAPYLRCSLQKNVERLRWLRETFASEAVANLKGAEILSQDLFGRPIKHIALVHPFEFDAELLDQVLTAWTSQGVEFIPLEEALDDPVYAINPSTKGALWTFLNQIRAARSRSNPPDLKPIYARTTEIEAELDKTCR
jgi:peptidoglycan/xylan/chitin deacetylase (PgdA/CDA1 family)